MDTTIYRSIPVWLRVGRGADHITYSDRNGQPARASWSPGNGTDTFGVSIGGPGSPVRGTLVGERYSRQILQACISQGLLPLPTNYAVTDRDDDLMKLVEIGSLPAWDALVVPVATVAGIMGVDTGATGPKAPAGLGGSAQGGGAQSAPGTGPGDGGLISHPAPPPPPVVALSTAPSPPTPAAPAAGTGGFTPEERTALVQLVERRFPGRGEKVASVVDLALAKDQQPLDLAKVLLPLLGVKDPRVLAALDLVALFGA